MIKEALERREFLKLGLAGLAVAAVGPYIAKRPKKKETSESHEECTRSWAMVINEAECVGCGHCVEACKAHNDVPPDIEWNRLIETGEDGDQVSYLTIPCMHCADAPCTHICPVGATYQREDGIIMMDYDRCIGCRYCEMACPYGSRSFNWKEFKGDNPAVPTWGQPEIDRRPRGVVEKCSFCYQRIDRGLAQGLTPGVDRAATPACVNACPLGARVFGDLNDPESPASKALDGHESFRLREGLGTEPRVYYLSAQGDPLAEEAELEAVS